MCLNNKTTIVTGAARGIGFAITQRFLAGGATVVMADVAPANGSVHELLARHPTRARYLETDVSVAASVQSMVNAAVAEFGPIDVLVNNAGVEFYKPVTTTTEDEWDHLMGVNLKGVFLCSRAVIPVMRKPGAAIVNIASELGLVGEASVAAYCASKGGVVMLSKAMAIDHGAEGVRVNALCPGPVATELLQGVFDSVDDPAGLRQRFEQRILLGRLGAPDEVAKAAVFLASEQSSFMTGASMVLDGGWTAH